MFFPHHIWRMTAVSISQSLKNKINTPDNKVTFVNIAKFPIEINGERIDLFYKVVLRINRALLLRLRGGREHWTKTKTILMPRFSSMWQLLIKHIFNLETICLAPQNFAKLSVMNHTCTIRRCLEVKKNILIALLLMWCGVFLIFFEFIFYFLNFCLWISDPGVLRRRGDPAPRL